MAEVEEAQFNSLADRIAALNRQKNFNTPEPARKRPPPPPVPKARADTASPPSVQPVAPPRPVRSNPPPLPRRDTQNSVASSRESSNGSARPPPPPLPSRASSTRPTPPELPKRTSTQSLVTLRRSSTTSDLSQPSSTIPSRPLSSKASNGSNHSAYQRKLPPAVSDPTHLPPLPPPRRAIENATHDARSRRALVTSSSPQPSDTSPTSRPSLPPRVPSRPKKSSGTPSLAEDESNETIKAPRKLPPMPILGFSSGQPTQRPSVPSRPESLSACGDDTPPPIPLASRPSLAQIEAVSSRAVTKMQVPSDCWVCRDWSGPDAVAAQYPRQSLPSNDPVGHLAQGLCGPFPSYTDKARAIFTWFHHNIFYDTEAFFGNNVQWKSVDDTIASGWAVCQGYAETYKAIANRAGLDCVVVCGHGKGFGHTPLKKGERPPPPKPDGHAWNAVRIDGGDWKLVDACWGAGHICGNNNLYKQELAPAQFTMSNEKFGLRHFPENPSYQFRGDGRTLSWEEYFRGPNDGEPPTFYTNGHQEGIAEDSVEPKERDIAVYGGQVVRFQFSKICGHWTPEQHGLGKPPLLLLSIHGLDGRKDEMVPFETNGYWHWVDVNARDLGAPGQSVQVAQLTTMNDRDARGVTASEFLSKRGKVGMSWAYVIQWELV